MKFKTKSKYFNEFIKNIRQYFSLSKDSIHKARNEIKVVDFENTDLVVKSFKVPNFINKIVYTFFKDSKAKKSYDNSIKIIDFVPKPIGYIEFDSFGLIADSYFISESFNFDFTIREPLLDAEYDDKENIFKEFAKFTYKLHENNILHLDYSPGNILIKKDSDGYTLKIVDINRMKFKELTIDERLENFNKLWAKDEDMKSIISEYSKLMGKDSEYCINKAIYYSQKNKDFKNFKKRLKGKKVVD
jgi:serine/threonine protein kinase